MPAALCAKPVCHPKKSGRLRYVLISHNGNYRLAVGSLPRAGLAQSSKPTKLTTSSFAARRDITSFATKSVSG